jgi:hypothetical protein
MNKQNKPEKKDQDKLYKYGNIVLNAKIDGSAKALLWFYAYVFNWENANASWWPQRKICALVGMAQSTYQKKRKYLEDLGWIRVLNRGFSHSCLVSVHVGQNDPEYENLSWAQWHPENNKKSNEVVSREFHESAAQSLIDDGLISVPVDPVQEQSDFMWDE